MLKPERVEQISKSASSRRFLSLGHDTHPKLLQENVRMQTALDESSIRSYAVEAHKLKLMQLAIPYVCTNFTVSAIHSK